MGCRVVRPEQVTHLTSASFESLLVFWVRRVTAGSHLHHLRGYPRRNGRAVLSRVFATSDSKGEYGQHVDGCYEASVVSWSRGLGPERGEYA